jgi:hypothetical protein
VHRRQTLLAAVLVGGTFALAVTPAADAAASPRSADGGGPTWTTYFYPLKVGWTCQEKLTTGAQGSETVTVAAVTKTDKGQAVTVDEGSSTEVRGTSVPTNAADHFLITKDGQLISTPSAGQRDGQSYQFVGNTVYPTVHTLLAGGSGLSHVHGTAPLGPNELAQIRSVLAPHATSLAMSVVFHLSGTRVAQLRTSAGTYHDVLAVRFTLRSLDVTNALPSARRELDREIEPTLAKLEANTVWYAPGHGPVKVVDGGVTGIVTGCGPSQGTGQDSNSSTTTPST